jgi:hypothetical protein
MTISNIEILILILIILGLSNWYIYWQNKNTNYNYDDTILDKINNTIDIKLKQNFKILENNKNKDIENIDNKNIKDIEYIDNKNIKNNNNNIKDIEYIDNKSIKNNNIKDNQYIENNNIKDIYKQNIENNNIKDNQYIENNNIKDIEYIDNNKDNQYIYKQIIENNNIKDIENIKDIYTYIHPEDYVSKRDKNVVYNNFAPPERRYYKEINIPTRGYPDNYQLIGILLRDNTENGYNLYGRQKYPGANQYEYYIQGVFHHNSIKIPIRTKGDKEIEDGMEIHIPGTDKKHGLFKLKLYDYDLLRYIPHIL